MGGMNLTSDGIVIEESMRFVGAGEMVISIDEYAELIQDQRELEILLDGIFEASRLSWSDDKLSFNDDAINTILRVCESRRHSFRLKELLKNKEADNGTDKD